MLSELGRRGGQKNRRYRPERSEIPQCPIKNVADVAALVTDTIHQVQSGELDHRDANAIGYLAGILLKALLEGHVEERLAELEALVGCSNGSGAEVFHFVAAKDQQTNGQSPKATEDNRAHSDA
jgi:hypothetical protein